MSVTEIIIEQIWERDESTGKEKFYHQIKLHTGEFITTGYVDWGDFGATALTEEKRRKALEDALHFVARHLSLTGVNAYTVKVITNV